MDNFIQKSKLLETILQITTDGIFKYDIGNDICSFYDMVDGRLAFQRACPRWQNLLYQSTDVESRSVIDKMIMDFANREDEATYEFKIKSSEKEQPYAWLMCHIKYQEQDDSYIGFVKKIDDRVSENLRLFDEATKDPLTKLVNKTYSVKLVREELAKHNCGALFIIDIDNFKSVNDTLGHLFGDEVIVSVANGIQSVFRHTDIVGRIGGDEFMVYAGNIGDRNAIMKKAEEICETVLKIYTGESEKARISASVGIAMIPDDGTGYEELFKKADHALYYTKNKGKNGFSFFDANNEEMLRHRRTGKFNDEIKVTEEVNEEMDAFYYEINDLTFRLLEDTKDADSAINLMLHKIQDKFQFSVIRVLEPTADELTLKCTYELTALGNSELGAEYVFTEYQWLKLNSLCNADPLYYGQSVSDRKDYELFQTSEIIKTGVIVSVNSNNCFIGAILYMDHDRERKLSKKELKVLKSFERVFSVYKVQMNIFADNDLYIKQLTERDNLTGLYKYNTFIDKLDEKIYTYDNRKKIVYVHCDVANFKYINEAFGYSEGDKLLKVFGGLVCSIDAVLLYASRVHSDNIVAVFVVSKDIPDDIIVKKINEKLEYANKELHKIIAYDNFYLNCGVCISSGSDHNYNRSITNADYARKLAKANRDGKCVFFDNKMFEDKKREMEIIEDFSDALKQKQFSIKYQPIVDTISKTTAAAEVLTRWDKDDKCILMPDDYVDILDRANKLTELDFYVICSVFEFIGCQMKAHKSLVPMSMNLSPKHLQDETFFIRLQELLLKYEVDPHYVMFELKESVFINQEESTIAFSRKLNEMGIRVSMDSFGFAYSAFNIMERLPISLVKIDRMFIKEKHFKKSEEVVLAGIVDMIKKLHKSVVALGVEYEEQQEFLCSIGCDMIQGNFYSEPLDETELLCYIESHKEVETESAYFKLDGNYEVETGKYSAYGNGTLLDFVEGILPQRRVLNFPGGKVGHEIVELSLGNLLANSFTVSVWFFEWESNAWTSLFYADYTNGFFSLIPSGWDQTGFARVMEKEEETEFYDAIGTSVERAEGWTHMAAVYNRKTKSLAFFLNGYLAGYKDDVIELESPGRVILGGDIYQLSFNGYVADLKVTNAPLSAQKIKEEYEKEKNNYKRR